jgi:hypothetical protein
VYCIDNSLFEAGLLQDIIQCAGRDINIRLAGNRHGAFLRRMLKLAMTTFHACLIPAIVLKQFDNFEDSSLAKAPSRKDALRRIKRLAYSFAPLRLCVRLFR